MGENKINIISFRKVRLAYICEGNVKKEVNIISKDKGRTDCKNAPSPFGLLLG